MNITVALIKPNPWNPNELSEFMESKLCRSIQEFGFSQAVIVRKLAENSYEIIDGEHRWGAAQRLGMDKVPCLDLGTMDDSEAKQLCEVFIHLHGNPDTKKEAELIKSLLEDDGLTVETLAHNLPLTAMQVESLYDSLNFDYAAFQKPVEGGTEDTDTNSSAPDTEQKDTPATTNTTLLQNGVKTWADGQLSFTALGLTRAGLDEILLTIEQAGSDDHGAVLENACRYYLEHHENGEA